MYAVQWLGVILDMFQKASIFIHRLWVAAKNEAKWYWSYVLMEIDQAGDLGFYFILFFYIFLCNNSDAPQPFLFVLYKPVIIMLLNKIFIM